ncbi:MAG: SIMPL domain-containing protein [Desulfovibrio sp.]|jgi:uncharacterized protein YggE|nr:SIMPL domain-containing protein [Desulfovibrio sp.]
MNGRAITVKGIGSVAAKPDLTVITMNLTTTMPDYAQTMERASKDVEGVRHALISIGYARESLKTANFNIRMEYDFFKDKNGDRKQKFKGYTCTHALKLELDFDMKHLGETLTAISTCGSHPDFKIAFSVKDKAAVSAELLESAITNAKDKAVVLAKAAGIQLGAIQRIDYSWGELRLLSETEFGNGMFCEVRGAAVDIEPEDIHANDSVTVVWEIE